MAEAAERDELIRRFRAEVLPCLVASFDPERVIAFGSRVRGEALRHSDLDVLVVAESFADVDWLDRAVRVYESCEVRLPLELLCYTPGEYGRKREELGIVRTATEEGVDLLSGVGG